ncbi:winged helix-turn-helix transcriptional regulator [candidate division KSB1 bacterium]|nr:winged helix-turn-helix transcriptional regulator [candidate division KSB1 bacterium]
MMANQELTELKLYSSATEQAGDIELANLARTLGHPQRVAILRFLAGCGACFCGDIVDKLPISQSTVSQHLKKLKEAGWIQGEIDGPRVCYCINPKTLDRFKLLIDALPTGACKC